MEVLYLILFAYVTYMLIVTIGITYGYHRYFSHKEFEANNWQEVIMLYCGLLCGGRSPLTWVGVHRMHHTYSDTELDPHSPIKGLWWSYLLWQNHKIDLAKDKIWVVKDMMKDPYLKFFHNHN